MITLSCGHVYASASWKQDSSCFYCENINNNTCSYTCQQQRNHRGFQSTKTGRYVIKRNTFKDKDIIYATKDKN
jgi:hypothetical protein